jgi:D-erythrose 4-phosphate dehydrogenase
MDLNLQLLQPATDEQINAVFAEATRGRFQGIMDYCDVPLASIDFNHDPHSCIVDVTQTRVSGGNLAKLLVWCDNEWGFANRMLDTAVTIMGCHE